eukprot:360856-Chlamydomonas_euryale.AAC.3
MDMHQERAGREKGVRRRRSCCVVHACCALHGPHGAVPWPPIPANMSGIGSSMCRRRKSSLAACDACAGHGRRAWRATGPPTQPLSAKRRTSSRDLRSAAAICSPSRSRKCFSDLSDASTSSERDASSVSSSWISATSACDA